MLFLNKIIKNNIMYIILFFFLVGCISEAESQYNYINESFEKNEIELKLIATDTLKGESFYFSQFLHRSFLKDENIIIIDGKFCRSIIYDLKSRNFSVIDENRFPQFEDCIHTVSKKKDTLEIFYSHGLKKILSLDDTLTSVLNFNTNEKEVHASHDLPISMLSNDLILVPTGVNIIHNSAYAKEAMDIRDPISYMKDQYLFALFNEDGQLINQFGRFPGVYHIPDLRQNSHKSYHYSVLDNKIYVAFAQTAVVQIYSLYGDLLETIHFQLPKFEELYNKNPKEGFYNAIDGFAVEKLNNKVNYYFKTIHPKKREQLLVKVDLGNQIINYSSVKLPIGLMMPSVIQGKWMYMNIPWDDEPIILKTFQF